MGDKDDVQLKDIEKNADVDDSTEKSPLKEAEGEAGERKDGKEDKPNVLLQSLQDPKTRRVVLLIGAVLLLILVVSAIAVVLIVASEPEPEIWLEDTIPRMLRLVPTPNGKKNTIKFRSGHGAEGGVYPNLTAEINNLFDVFERSNNFGKKNVTNCDGRATPPADEKWTCFYDASSIKRWCDPEKGYGYPDGSPCIFIQFNNVRNFTPIVFNKQDLEDQSLPEDLRASYQYRGPYIECKPNEIVDIENAGKVEFYPGHEFPLFAFPYKGHPDYLAPFIAIKLEKPQTAVNIGITCKLLARNVVYNATTSGLNDTLVDEQYVPSAILPFNVFIEWSASTLTSRDNTPWRMST